MLNDYNVLCDTYMCMYEGDLPSFLCKNRHLLLHRWETCNSFS